MKVKDYIQESYSKVELFNTICGNLNNVSLKLVINQLDYITEELKETIEATDETDLLDGCVDLFVTVAGLMQKLEAAGFNVAEAMKRVDANNLDKLPLSRKVSFYRVGRDEVDFADEAPFEAIPANCTTSFVGDRVVFKNYSGKVMKPKNFVPVDLTGLSVEGFLSK